MFTVAKRSAGVVCLTLMLVAASLLTPAISKAANTPTQTADLLQGQVTVTKLLDTTTDVVAGPRCTNMTVQVMRNILNALIAAPEVHCMLSTSAGFIDNNSTIIQPLGMSKAYPLQINHGGQPVILPIGGSASALLLTNDTAYPGLNVGVYNDLFTRLTFSNNPLSMKYTLNGEPDYYLRYSNGRNLAANVVGPTLSFSNDGRYMIVDGVFQGFERVDLTNPQMVIFASDLPRVNDTGLLPAATAVSATGRYAAIAYSAPGGWGSKYLQIVDVNSCGNSISSCKMVDVYSQLKAAVPTLGTIDRVDFSSENSLLVTARYDFDGQKSKEGQFAITPAGQSASREEYLAMGDSYISGEGAGSYLLGTDTSDNPCHLSLQSYPYLLGKNLNSVASVACSGANTANVSGIDINTSGRRVYQIHHQPSDPERILAASTHMPGVIQQADFLSIDSPDIITASVGGNDVGFADVVTSCVTFLHLDVHDQNCYRTYEERRALLNQIDSQFNNLYQTYQQLKTNAPTRRIYVIGYPQIINPNGSCAANVHLSQSDAQFAEQLTDYLDSVISKAAAKAGVMYVDTQHAFDGHRLCDNGEKAVNGLTKGDDKLLSMIANESYHPNAYGHELFADVISKATNNLTTPMPATQNIANPNADDSLPILQAVINTHQQIYDIQNVNTNTQELLFAGSRYTVPSSSSPPNLAPSSTINVVLHSDPMQLGTVQTDSKGIMSGTVQIPSNVPAGFHTIHYYGTNIAGELVDIQDVVYVAASANDYDGDGIANASDSCPTVPQSGEDVDKDGIDDACDGDIGPAPIAPPEVISQIDAATQATANNVQPAFTFALANVQNPLTVYNRNDIATDNEMTSTNVTNNSSQVLSAQTFAATKPLPKLVSNSEVKFTNAKLIIASFASLGLIAAVCFGLLRLRDR